MHRHSSKVDQPVAIDDLFNQSIEQYLHHKVSVVDKNLIICLITAHIPDIPKLGLSWMYFLRRIYYMFIFTMLSLPSKLYYLFTQINKIIV